MSLLLPAGLGTNFRKIIMLLKFGSQARLPAFISSDWFRWGNRQSDEIMCSRLRRIEINECLVRLHGKTIASLQAPVLAANANVHDTVNHPNLLIVV